MKVPGHPSDCDCIPCSPPSRQWTARPARPETPEELARRERGRKWLPGSASPAPVQRRDEWWKHPGIRVTAGGLGVALLLLSGTAAAYLMLGAFALILIIAAGVRLGSR